MYAHAKMQFIDTFPNLSHRKLSFLVIPQTLSLCSICILPSISQIGRISHYITFDPCLALLVIVLEEVV